MSVLLDKTVSSNISEADSDFKFSKYYKNILQKSKKKITYNFQSYRDNLNKYKSFGQIRLKNKSKEASSQANSTDKFEVDNYSKKPRNLKQSKINLLFNNLLIREKQKTFKNNSLNSLKINDYKMLIKKEIPIKTPPYIVNNNSSLFQIMLNQTKSNFNNKYQVIYSISDWRQKDKIKSLFESIKNNQHKNSFSDYLRAKLFKNSSIMRLKRIKYDINKEKEETDSLNKISLYNNICNDFLKNIFHKNNLIKLKTMSEVNNKLFTLKKNKTAIFFENNLLFKTMPMRELKTEQKNSSPFPK